jgi:LPXTG-motif cell wall-anchored protein
MSEGLTFEQNPGSGRGVTEIKHVNSLGVETTLTLGTDYTVSVSNADACTFEVVFSETLIASLKPNDRLLVYYNAMLNRHAQVGSASGNENESWLEYGEANHTTTHDKTKTYTFSIDIVKTDSSNQLIDGAKFRIYDAPTGGNEVRVVKLYENDDVTPKLDANGNQMYRRARADELIGDDIVVTDGVVTVVGFDNGIYYLEETEAPAGYNKLTSRKEFTIADANLDSAFSGGIYSSGSGVHVVNKTGTMLPETGATGTMLFIGFGTFVVLFTGVLLVTKKRFSMIEE